MVARQTTTILAAAGLALVAAVGVLAVGPNKAEAAGTRALVCKVFLTQFKSDVRFEVALPYRAVADDGRKVVIRRLDGSKSVRAPVKDIGPWNLNDAYWLPESRRVWKGLERCQPEAQAAFSQDYNGGNDQFGRLVVNPAGIDVTPAVAHQLGLRTDRSAWVYVKFPWVSR